jgi:hypothetical protein
VHLTLPNAFELDEDLAPALYAALPPNLTRFPNVLVHSLNEVTAAALPRQIVGPIHTYVYHRYLHLLPQGVSSVGISDFSKEDLYEIQGFPSSLRDITMAYLDERTAKLLPRHLRSLVIDEVVFTPSILASLPPSITELISMYGCPFNSVEEWKLLGRDLKVLDTAPSLHHNDLGIPIPTAYPESSSWLPNRLVFLALGRLDIQHAEWFANLPSTLEILELQVVSIPFDSFQHIKLLKLRDLHLTATPIDPKSGSGSPSEDQSIPLANLLQTLPSSLEEFIFKSLNSNPWNYSNEDLTKLPPLMHTLLLPESTTPVTSELLPYLPRTLISCRNWPWWTKYQQKKKDGTRSSNEKQLLELASEYGFPTNGITNMFGTAKPRRSKNV